MAKTYNIREMAKAIKNRDCASIADFGSRYPLVAIKLAELMAKAPDEAYEFCQAMPEYLTGQKLNAAFKDALLGDSEDSEQVEVDESAEVAEEKPAKAEKPKKADGKEASDYASMSGKALYDLIKEKGLKKHYIEVMNDKKFPKQLMVDYLEKYGLSGAGSEAKAEAKPAEEEKEDLAAKTPLQLYDICTKRGIKAKTRQPKEYYLNLLAEAEKASGPEDWDDTEDVEALEKAEPKKNKKDKKEKSEPAEDDGDDWDI